MVLRYHLLFVAIFRQEISHLNQNHSNSSSLIIFLVYRSLLFDKLMRMRAPPSLQPPHGRIIDHKHNEVIQPNIMPIRIKPKRQDPLIHHHSLNHQSTQLRHHCRPHQVLIIRLRDHQADEGQHEGDDGAFDFCFGDGELAGWVVEVEATESDATGKEGQVIEVVIFVEAIGAVDELCIAVIPLQHLVYEVKGRHACEDEED